MLHQSITPRRAKDQLEELRSKGMPTGGRIVRIDGIQQKVITNPSVPFFSKGMEVLAVRADPGLELPDSKTYFCTRAGDGFRLMADAPVLALEDPFVTSIGGQIVLGGVRLIWKDGAIDAWVTVFYRGDSIDTLKYLCTGPRHMKDIRLVELADGRVGVFSRPQGQKMLDKYGRIAQIGFAVADSLEAVTAEFIENAPYLQGLFLPDEWGGVNQAYLLKNGLIGVIGHKAWGEMIDGVHFLHYYSMAFAVDPETSNFTEPKIISARQCFEAGPASAERVRDVTFTAGIVRKPSGKAELVTGLSDMQIGIIEIDDPLVEYEEMKR
jgi:hypothetical protein